MCILYPDHALDRGRQLHMSLLSEAFCFVDTIVTDYISCFLVFVVFFFLALIIKVCVRPSTYLAIRLC